MSLPKVLPILSNLDKNGKSRQWQVVVDSDKYYTVYGLLEGKKTTSKPTQGKIKNKGHSNEVLPEQQAVIEAHSKWMSKVAEGYEIDESINTTENVVFDKDYFYDQIQRQKKNGGSNIEIKKDKTEQPTILPDNENKQLISSSDQNKVDLIIEVKKPMACNPFEPNEKRCLKNVGWINGKENEVFVDAKLDGVRCIASYYKNDELGKEMIVLSSRQGKQFPVCLVKHIKDDLLVFFRENPEIVLDGEFYIHNPSEEFVDKFKELKGKEDKKVAIINIVAGIVAVGRKSPVELEIERELKYHVFDVIDDDDMVKRNTMLDYIFSMYKFDHVIKVERRIAKNWDETKKIFAEFIKDNYEGIIIRKFDSKYLQGHRSNEVFKYKEFFDMEVEIQDCIEGTGNDQGKAIWICIIPDSNKTFNCRSSVSDDQRKYYFEHKDEFIGKMLTVRYQELTDSGIPRFPVGVSIRDYE